MGLERFSRLIRENGGPACCYILDKTRARQARLYKVRRESAGQVSPLHSQEREKSYDKCGQRLRGDGAERSGVTQNEFERSGGITSMNRMKMAAEAKLNPESFE